jgi:MoaA/NifB/PqqE/SkfB family radical SAM enzyme
MKRIKAPLTIDLNVTGRCNMGCRFCWGPSHEIGEVLSTKQWQKIIKEFVLYGTKAVVFTGGEPLLRKDLGRLLAYAKNTGLRVTLSTNGIFLKQMAKKILPFVDELGIPLDGSDELSSNLMRPGLKNNFKLILELIEYLKQNYPQIELTVRTVISKKNKDEILKIGQLLSEKKYKPARWKLYEFTPLEYGKINKNEFFLNHQEFEKILQKTQKTFPRLNISSLKIKERGGRYFLLMPDASAFAVDRKGKLVFLGNVLYNFFTTLEKASFFIFTKRNRQHGLFRDS